VHASETAHGGLEFVGASRHPLAAGGQVAHATFVGDKQRLGYAEEDLWDSDNISYNVDSCNGNFVNEKR